MKTFRFDKIPELFVQIIRALPVTAEYVLLSLVIGVLFGFLLALAKLGKNRILKSLAYGYTTIMRCVPSVVLLFVVYYGLPRVISIDTAGKIKFVVITLSLFTAGSLSETFRSAYLSIDRIQTEAAKSIGMTGIQSFIHVLLPQMLRISIPNISNSILALVKEGALAYTIGLYDLLGRANYILGKHMGAFVIETYVTLIIIYWPISSLITFLGAKLEKRLSFDGKLRKEAGNA